MKRPRKEQEQDQEYLQEQERSSRRTESQSHLHLSSEQDDSASKFKKRKQRSHGSKSRVYMSIAACSSSRAQVTGSLSLMMRKQKQKQQRGAPIAMSRLLLTITIITVLLATRSTSTIQQLQLQLHMQPVHSLSLNTPSLSTRKASLSSSSTSIFMAASSSSSSSLSTTRTGRPRRNNNSNNNNNNNNGKYNSKYKQHPAPIASGESRWQRAIRIEQRTQFALEDLQQRSNFKKSNNNKKLFPSGKKTIIIRRRNSEILSSVPSNATSTLNPPPTFPDIRECNSALAALGDGGDLLRALRLYFKMRKATNIALSMMLTSDNDNDHANGNGNGNDNANGNDNDNDNDNTFDTATGTPIIPTPTLVTYSTLMSRAISLGKPQVALRLWKIMRDQKDFFSYASYYSETTQSTTTYTTSSTIPASAGNNASAASGGVTLKASELKNLIVPDVKSANILMNTYAKLGDIDAAEDLMKQMQTKPMLPQQQQKQQQQPQKSPSSSSSSSLHDVIFGGGIDVPYLKPNLVTYNTLLDACQKSGEIDKALHWKAVLERESKATGRNQNRADITYSNGRTRSIRLRPDARTYTILIGTVAKASRSYSYGTHDPSLAFQLLDEMKHKHHIAPNPLTYSALIDVCGRCRRADLALKALRLMLRDKQTMKRMNAEQQQNRQQQQYIDATTMEQQEQQQLQQTVGAWTAAINACGKTGRIDTALKLFFVSMPRFKVKPNVITCSCLLDSLLKQGKTADSLDVLRYMKNHNLSPSEYMYTSLMTYASRLAGLEQNNNHNDRKDGNNNGTTTTNRPWPSLLESDDASPSNGSSNNETLSGSEQPHSKGGGQEDETKAVDVYSELMSTLIATTKRKTTTQRPPTEGSPITTNNELYQVTMVFREMKASGVVPDLGSYNTLLRSCANSGDMDRAQEILRDILDQGNDLEPNDRTWRAVLKTAGKAKRSDMVLQTWKSAVAGMGGDNNKVESSATKKNRTSSLSTSSPSSSSSSSSSSPSKKQKKRKYNNLSLQTFRALLMALLICAWDLRESDRHTSIQLYKIIIKCYNALHSSSSSPLSPWSSSSSPSATSSDNSPADNNDTPLPTPPVPKQKELYLGMHLLDSKAAMDNPQVLTSILQAVVNLESLLDEDDSWKEKLKQLGASIAEAGCLNNNGGGRNRGRSSSSSLTFFDKKALNTARNWTN